MVKGNGNWCFIITLPNGCIGVVIEIASLLRLEGNSSDTVVLPRCSYKYISPFSTVALLLREPRFPPHVYTTSMLNFKLTQVWFSFERQLRFLSFSHRERQLILIC
ncbi:hypothetical protein BJX68DRAFT_189491 [Aspergillus pseudodeflectus]|uniref:Uncharacterized protein n=1 Tax=Aspergillus pseudodeflectus TaxID=176178 RepID=A0ABR4JJS7_9EURO